MIQGTNLKVFFFFFFFCRIYTWIFLGWTMVYKRDGAPFESPIEDYSLVSIHDPVHDLTGGRRGSLQARLNSGTLVGYHHSASRRRTDWVTFGKAEDIHWAGWSDSTSVHRRKQQQSKWCDNYCSSGRQWYIFLLQRMLRTVRAFCFIPKITQTNNTNRIDWFTFHLKLTLPLIFTAQVPNRAKKWF